MKTSPLSAGFGIEIADIDLTAPIDDKTFGALRDAWFDTGVMVVRGQALTPEAQIAFARRFGELAIHVMDQFLLPGHPEILVLSNRRRPDGTPEGFEDAGRYWHSDVSYEERPALGSQLYAVEIPPEGGDTMFQDMVRAYDTLPAELKRAVEGRRALHSFTRNYKRNETQEGGRPAISAAQGARLKDVAHPIVRTMEDTGRKALYVNPGFTWGIEGMDEAEGRALLDALFAHSRDRAFRYVHKWRPGDLLCWDNRSVMHHATPYDTQYIRHMHRTTIRGPRPV